MFFLSNLGMMGGGGQEQAGGGMMFFIMMALMVAIFYFLMIRPQTKARKAHEALLSTLSKGDKVVTSGGVYGKVAGVKETDNIVVLEIAKDVKIEISKASVARVLNR